MQFKYEYFGSDYTICALHIDNLPIGYAMFCYEQEVETDAQNYYEKCGLAAITCLEINSEYRHQGYGATLMREVMGYLYDHSIRYAELDDVSDYMRKPNCIYVKLGFVYDSDDNHMICNLRHALN